MGKINKFYSPFFAEYLLFAIKFFIVLIFLFSPFWSAARKISWLKMLYTLAFYGNFKIWQEKINSLLAKSIFFILTYIFNLMLF